MKGEDSNFEKKRIEKSQSLSFHFLEYELSHFCYLDFIVVDNVAFETFIMHRNNKTCLPQVSKPVAHVPFCCEDVVHLNLKFYEFVKREGA